MERWQQACRSLLRFSGSIRCSIHSGTTPASRNYSPRRRRSNAGRLARRPANDFSLSAALAAAALVLVVVVLAPVSVSPGRAGRCLVSWARCSRLDVSMSSSQSTFAVTWAVELFARRTHPPIVSPIGTWNHDRWFPVVRVFRYSSHGFQPARVQKPQVLTGLRVIAIVQQELPPTMTRR